MRFTRVGPQLAMIAFFLTLLLGLLPSAGHGAGMTCMPAPSACGFPDVTNTGVTPGTPLTPVSGTVTLSTPGQVYENKVVTGAIVVTAPNVTIRNVRLIDTDPYYAVSVKNGNSWENTQANLTLDHVEINLNGHLDIKGIAFNGYTARNVLFHNGADCAHMGVNVTIQDSYCLLGPDANSDGQPDSRDFCNGPDHYDGFQSDGGDGITLRHNTIRNPCGQTSAILMSTNTEPIRNVVIDANLASGGGYTIYCGTDSGGVAANTTYTNNVFSKEFYAKGGYYGASTSCEGVAKASNNGWDGNFVPPPGTPTGGGTGTTGSGSSGTGAKAGGSSPTGSAGGGAGSTPASALDVGVVSPKYLLTLRQARSRIGAALKRQLGRRYSRRAGAVRLTCRRGSRSVFTCSAGWRVRSGSALYHYSGSVRVARTGPTRYRYAIALSSWSSRCRCSAPVRRKGTFKL
jgi:hypothetical protein